MEDELVPDLKDVSLEGSSKVSKRIKVIDDAFPLQKV